MKKIYSDIITLNDAFEKQVNLKGEINEFIKSTKLKKPSKKEEKYWSIKTQRDFLKENRKFLMVLKAKYFQ